MHLSYYRRPIFLLLAAYAACLFLLRGRLLRPPPGLPFELPRAGAVLRGRVAEYPVAAPGGLRFALEVTSVYGRPAGAGVMAYVKGDGGGASYGDTVELFADLYAPPGAAAPGSLDWADYLARRGIEAQARAHEIEVVRPAGPVLRLARRVRESALASFRRALEPGAAAVLGGVVLGEKRSVPPDLKAAFQDSGAMHLLVASGSNVGFVVGVVYLLGHWLGLRRRHAGLAALLAAGFYVLAAGLDAPLVRAYLMFSAGLCAWLLRRESGAFQALCAAALAILLFSPRSLFDAGFQMSFLAAYGLTVGLAAWGRYLPGGWAGKVLGLLLVSACAQLCLYPVLAAYFHKVSLVSLLSNMVLVPAAGAAMAVGFLLAAGGGWFFSALAWAAGWFMKFFLGAVKFFAALPFASVAAAEPSALEVAGFLALALALLHAPLLGARSRRLWAAAAAGAALLALGPLAEKAGAGAARRRALLFGDSDTACALVSVPSGLYLVNPGLPGRRLADAVLAQGRRELDGVLFTSLEEQNYSGLAALARLVGIRRAYLPYGPVPAGLAAALDGLGGRDDGPVRLWAGEAAGAVKAAWGGPPGYTGGADALEWEIDGVLIYGGGLSAVPACGGQAATGEPGRTVVLEIGPPGCR